MDRRGPAGLHIQEPFREMFFSRWNTCFRDRLCVRNFIESKIRTNFIESKIRTRMINIHGVQ